MAPGRKRGGAKGAKAKSQLNLGDLVLAKVKGFPAWPAKISKPEDWERTPDPKKYFVQFFGTEEIAFVAPVDIQPFTSESKNKLLARCKGKTVKYFSQAVREICDTFEELQHKSSDSLKDGNDGESFQPDVNSTEMVEDGMTTDGPSGETSFNDIANHGPGLERCSHIHREMDYEDEKPSVSPIANDGSPSAVSTKKRNEFCNDDVTSPKEESIITSSAGHNKNSKSGLKIETNGQKSKKIARASKKKHNDDDDELNKIHSPVGVGSAVQSSHLESAGTENSKDVIRKSSLHGSKNDVTVGVINSEFGGNIKKPKKLLKDKTHVVVADDLSKDVEGVPMERNSVELTGRKMKSEPGLGKDNVLSNGVLHPTKRSKCSDDVSKRSHTPRKNDVSGKGGNEEVKKSTLSLKTKNRLTSKGQTNGLDSGVLGDEDVLPPAKRRRRAIEAMSGSTSMSEDRIAESSIPPKKGENSDAVRNVPQVPMKRRAVRICDDDEDEPKTPVHGGSAKGVDRVSHISVSVEEGAAATETIQDSPGARNLSVNAKEVPSSKQLAQPSPNSRQDITEIVERQFSHSPGKESDKKSSEEVLKVLVSPIKSPVMIDSYNPTKDPVKVNKSVGKVSGNVSQKKGQAGSFKASSGIYDGGHRSQNNAVNERSRPVISGEKQKSTPKSSSRVADSAAVLRKPSESNLLSSERFEYVRMDRTTSSADSRNADSNKSMKHLIAVAQAKRKQAQSQSLVHEGLNYSQITTTEAIIRSPGSSSVVQPIPAGPGIMVQSDGQGYRSQASLASPSSRVLHYISNDQPDTAEFEETRTSSGHRPAGGSLSGGTEAAVARDAFEGMIETLSRTKESIGRATRHAIDCAKHGIANEVVELLTRKLESESSFHRRVDLFFLVDSITQCSHSQKGIAGASYIPTVQAALPRLLGAAAPPGANARENRRQCLKVLKLWLERKILPDSLLRSYIEDIGASNDDASTGFFSKRPSRSERAVDDPIREMEGMLVDEYGSNATFQLPGFLSSNVFEEEDDDDILNFTRKESIGKSSLELNPSSGELETCSLTPNDRRHCILEDVDGELEMEDVSGHPKDEKFMTGGSYKAVQLEEISDRMMDAGSNNSNEVSPFREGSPPLPLDSPPPTPPLPSSPPPPLSPMVPPPPSSPSPPPPPPPSPPPSQTYPLHPSNAGPPQTFPQTSLPLQALPQASTTPQHVHQYQSAMPSNVSLNTRLGAHVDAAVRGEMFPQQPSCFVPAVASSSREPSGFNSSRTVEYGHETYTNPQGSQSNQQFQSANVPLPARAFQPPMLPQTAGGQFQYPKPAMLQHPYPPLYGLTKPPDGPRRYGADEQWRPTSNEFNSDNQRGAWISSGRTSLSSVPPFTQEGYFRPPMERPPTNNVGFHPTGQNIVPAGAPIPGQSGSLMMPCRPDMPSLNSWRPA